MAYIGKTPVLGNFVKLDAISVVNGQAAYTMQNGGVNFTSYDNVNQFLVSLNGILQSPTDSFTVSGSTLTFASNLSTGDVIDFVLVLGNSLDIGTPSDNTVTTAKIGANAVTSAKLNNDIISGATELASEPADTDEFLVSDAGTLKRIDYSLIKGGGITMADQWRLTTDTNNGSNTDVTSNWERNDASSWSGIGTGLTESSGVFTLPQTGIYKIDYQGVFGVATGDGNCEFLLKTTTDNSTYTVVTHTRGGAGNAGTSDESSGSFLFDVTNTTTHKFKFATNSFGSGTVLQGSTNLQMSGFSIIRLGDT